jgi:hypothetical protein
LVYNTKKYLATHSGDMLESWQQTVPTFLAKVEFAVWEKLAKINFLIKLRNVF